MDIFYFGYYNAGTNLLSSLIRLGHAVQPKELVPLEVEVVLDDGHALGHLAEHQDAVPGGLQLRQDPVDQFELAARPVDVRAGHYVGEVSNVLGVRLLDMLEHERVVAKLPETFSKMLHLDKGYRSFEMGKFIGSVSCSTYKDQCYKTFYRIVLGIL